MRIIEIVQVFQTSTRCIYVHRVEPIARLKRHLTADDLIFGLGVAGNVHTAHTEAVALRDAVGDLHRVARSIVEVRYHGSISISTRSIVAADHLNVSAHFFGRIRIAADESQSWIKFLGLKNAHLAETDTIHRVASTFIDRHDEIHLAIARGHTLNAGARYA